MAKPVWFSRVRVLQFTGTMMVLCLAAALLQSTSVCWVVWYCAVAGVSNTETPWPSLPYLLATYPTADTASV